jgi:glutamine synthetase
VSKVVGIAVKTKKTEILPDKPAYKQGYFPVSPTDTSQDIRTEMLVTMADCGVPIEKHHHEVATGGQNELGINFSTLVSRPTT